MYSDHFSVYTLDYTSSVEFRIKKPPTIRIGPLMYVTSDVEFYDCNPNPHPNGPMQHKMLEGTYRIHRVNKTYWDNEGRPLENQTNGDYTVITLQEIDPLKIVKSLDTNTSVTSYDLKCDMVFDNKRWMQFAGSATCPAILQSNSNHPRDVLRQSIAQTAYVSNLCSTTKLCESTNYVVDADRMIQSDINTFYIRLLSKRFTRGWHIKMSTPDMREFSVTVGACRCPTMIGIAQGNHPDGTFGYVLYTDYDLHGYTLPRKRAFAVVLGPALREQTIRDLSSFDPLLRCGDFVYEHLKEGGVLSVSGFPSTWTESSFKENIDTDSGLALDKYLSRLTHVTDETGADNNDDEKSISDFFSECKNLSSESIHAYLNDSEDTANIPKDELKKPFPEDLAEFVVSQSLQDLDANSSPEATVRNIELWLYNRNT